MFFKLRNRAKVLFHTEKEGLTRSQFAIFVGIGVVVIAIAVAWIWQGTKGNHLELNGEILKVRTGALDDNSSAAILDFRVKNVSDVPFVVRTVEVEAEMPDGKTATGELISKTDYNILLQYNQFLGPKYNDGLSLRDKIAPRQQMDRMVAVRFEIPLKMLASAKSIHLMAQDVDGTKWETVYAMPPS